MEDDELPAALEETAEPQTVSQAVAATAGNSSGKRKPGRPALHHGCQVCGGALDHLKLFHQRYHICMDCMALEKIVVKGVDSRFCQQCGRFHELEAFAAGMRSCRRQLAKHAERRRRARELAAMAAGKDARRRHVQAQGSGGAGHAAAEASQDALAGAAVESQPEAKRSRGQEEGMGEAPQPRVSLDTLLGHSRLPPLPWRLPDAGSGSAGSTAHLAHASGDTGGLQALVAAAEEEHEGSEAARGHPKLLPAAASSALPPLQLPQAGAHASVRMGGAAAALAASLPPPASTGGLHGAGLPAEPPPPPGPAQPLLVRSHNVVPQHSTQLPYTSPHGPSPPQQQQQQPWPVGEQKLVDLAGVLSALGGMPAGGQAVQGTATQQAVPQGSQQLAALAAALSQAASEHQRRQQAEQQQQQQQQLMAALAALVPAPAPAAPPAAAALQQLLQRLGQPSAPTAPAPSAPSLGQPLVAALPTLAVPTQQAQGSADLTAALFQSAVGELLLSILDNQQR